MRRIGNGYNGWPEHAPYDRIIVAAAPELIPPALIAQLKPGYREVILLREYEHLSYADIARVTQDTESAVKARLFKARKALVKKLKPYFGEQS